MPSSRWAWCVAVLAAGCTPEPLPLDHDPAPAPRSAAAIAEPTRPAFDDTAPLTDGLVEPTHDPTPKSHRDPHEARIWLVQVEGAPVVLGGAKAAIDADLDRIHRLADAAGIEHRVRDRYRWA